MEGYGNENPGAFQPTRPLRGATEIAHKLTDTIKFQPTRPLRGATPCFHRGIAQSKFQPTRPLRGATSLQPFVKNGYIKFRFQPTRPLRGATGRRCRRSPIGRYFNPRAPCGARQIVCGVWPHIVSISTHAPLAGRDPDGAAGADGGDHFNPRAPCGARLEDITLTIPPYTFQPTRPLRGATIQTIKATLGKALFQPTRPLRGATLPHWPGL